MSSQSSRWTRAGVIVLKFAVSLAILAYLFSTLRDGERQTLRRMLAGPIWWPPLLATIACYTLGLIANWIRWNINLRILGVRCRFSTIVHLGMLTYMLEFVAAGTVASEVVKGVMLAREQSGQRAQVAISVIVDKLIGLLSFLIFVSLAFALLSQASAILMAWLHGLAWVTSAIVAVALALLVGHEPVLDTIRKLSPEATHRVVDRIGHTLASYRTQVAALAAALAVSFVAVGCQVVAFYMATKAFPLPAATLLEQAVIVPVAALSNVVPLPVNGLGLLDFAMSWLTEQVTLGRIAAAEVMLALLAIRAAQMVMVLTALWLYSAPFAGRNSAAAAS